MDKQGRLTRLDELEVGAYYVLIKGQSNMATFGDRNCPYTCVSLDRASNGKLRSAILQSSLTGMPITYTTRAFGKRWRKLTAAELAHHVTRRLNPIDYEKLIRITTNTHRQ